MKTSVLFFTAVLIVAITGNLNASYYYAIPDSGGFTKVEIQPEFPGGQTALVKYISTNVKYPDKAKKDGTEGKVYVSFVVKKDGSIKDVKALRGVSKECDNEAIRVISSMPDWKPGSDGKKAVDVKMNIPIHFKLNKEKK